jgi:DNA-binding XRE family transcriptional regulator
MAHQPAADRRRRPTPAAIGRQRWDDERADPDVKAHILKAADYVAANLYALRERQGWTQSQAAHVIGIRRETITDIENCRRIPDLPTMVRMAFAYGLADASRLLLPPLESGFVRSTAPDSRHCPIQP